METAKVLTEENLYRFLEQHENNRVKRELLAFWGIHPNAKFGRRAICYALDCGKLEADRALRALVEAGLIDTHMNNGLTLYSLTRDEAKRRMVLELATLDWDQRQLMLKRIERRDKSTEPGMLPKGMLRHNQQELAKWRGGIRKLWACKVMSLILTRSGQRKRGEGDRQR